METLILAANPGSSSRKYALYAQQTCIASLNFEHNETGRIVCTVINHGQQYVIDPKIDHLDAVTVQVLPILKRLGIIKRQVISGIGLRVVAPSGYFLTDHLLNEEAIERLRQLEPRAPLHISVTLREIERLKKHYQNLPIGLISDSAFHRTKPDYAWNYGLPLEDADALEIKRFGYHGISMESVVQKLVAQKKLPAKLIICHLGSGNSVAAIVNGESLDTTMGYSPVEGLIMATRSGSIDWTAILALKNELKIDENRLDQYLNKSSGLFGISGVSPDIRELLELEANGHYRAGLAIRMYVYKIQQAIAAMAAAMGGVDGLVFTGTVGDRSFPIRQRIIANLDFLGLAIQPSINKRVFEPTKIMRISPRKRIRPIYVMTTDETFEIAQHTLRLVAPPEKS